MLAETGDLGDLRRRGYAAELKLDGTRALIIKENGRVHIQNRKGVDYTRRLQDLVVSASKIPRDFIVDGEVVCLDQEGRNDFVACQRRCSTQDLAGIYYLMRKYPAYFYAFDILGQNREDLTNLQYIERKRMLKGLLSQPTENIQYLPHRFDLEEFFLEVRRQEGEGIMLKAFQGTYEPGRSSSWLKVKNWRSEVCDVVGYTAGKNARRQYFGSLVLAKDGRLCGCVGSGFTETQLKFLTNTLKNSPQVPKPFEIDEVYTAIRTDLKVEVKFYQLTKDRVMRFPVFLRSL